jgi:hypothetical protein
MRYKLIYAPGSTEADPTQQSDKIAKIFVDGVPDFAKDKAYVLDTLHNKKISLEEVRSIQEKCSKQ